ncbi:hypothetical protein [uncultured Methanolobus sp.]|nr:hypothetical protein [uncultured Methanolobus sp.]
MKRSLSILLAGMLLVGVVAISGCTDTNMEIAGTEETRTDELIAAQV